MLHKSDYEQYTNRRLWKSLQNTDKNKVGGLEHVSATVEISDSEYEKKTHFEKMYL